ncbi:N-acetyltransferase [Pseudomonas baetica]|uniref:N-acetyltransferase n=1 Tax=Pseudomonas baetica TaxID=674054 RepID=UPI003EEF1D24
MSALQKLITHIKEKGLRATAKKVWKHFVFYHEELLWLERDLVSPVQPHKLKPYPSLRLEIITPQNTVAFTRHFAERVQTMTELAREGHTGHMYLDDTGDAVAFIWGTAHGYHDHHYYRCWFPVKEGEFFEFAAEQIRAYWGTLLSLDFQLNLWKAMQAQGCNKVVDVCETRNIRALKMHIRMGFNEQGRIMNVYKLFGRWRYSRETRYTGSRLDALRKPAHPPVTA